MRQILSLSYKNLPRQLKTCFLYLGIYPEDYITERDDLVRRWVAEGLVSNSGKQDAGKELLQCAFKQKHDST